MGGSVVLEACNGEREAGNGEREAGEGRQMSFSTVANKIFPMKHFQSTSVSSTGNRELK